MLSSYFCQAYDLWYFLHLKNTVCWYSVNDAIGSTLISIRAEIIMLFLVFEYSLELAIKYMWILAPCSITHLTWPVAVYSFSSNKNDTHKNPKAFIISPLMTNTSCNLHHVILTCTRVSILLFKYQ